MNVPDFLYGTAWKEERTEELVTEALRAGFRGIDTANQRKHYHEAGTGAAIARSGIAREQLFIQTKFTHIAGQDTRLPYDATANLTTQVNQSFDSSLQHLGTTYIDSYVLHGPSTRRGFAEDDREVWRAMESLHHSGRTHHLGISNVTAEQLALLCTFAEVRPTFVQNRCYASTGWDRETREICRREGITYQGFSLLTANETVRSNPALHTIAVKHHATAAQIVFRFAQQIGMVPLTGTSDPVHMREDLAVGTFQLDEQEIGRIERMGMRASLE